MLATKSLHIVTPVSICLTARHQEFPVKLSLQISHSYAWAGGEVQAARMRPANTSFLTVERLRIIPPEQECNVFKPNKYLTHCQGSFRAPGMPTPPATFRRLAPYVIPGPRRRMG